MSIEPDYVKVRLQPLRPDHSLGKYGPLRLRYLKKY